MQNGNAKLFLLLATQKLQNMIFLRFENVLLYRHFCHFYVLKFTLFITDILQVYFIHQWLHTDAFQNFMKVITITFVLKNRITSAHVRQISTLSTVGWVQTTPIPCSGKMYLKNAHKWY
jgi:hypothetical protein